MRCIAFDRLLDTDRRVPGALPAGNEDGDGGEGGGKAIRIRWHPAIAPTPGRPVWTRTTDALWFDPPGVARYRCTPEGIEVTPIAGADLAHVDALLIATALPALLWLQGDIVLHAAAVVPPASTHALAIAGPSGSGKSHLAAALLAQGARLVADDSIAVRGSVCAGLAGGYHLGGHLGARGGEDRAFHPVSRACRSAPLGTLIVLDDDPAPCARLTGVAAVQALLANRHRASVPRLCGLESRALAGIARLARDVAVFRGAVFRASQNDADMLLDARVRARIEGAGK